MMNTASAKSATAAITNRWSQQFPIRKEFKMAERIQRKRTAGWKMPPNTVAVSRPSLWGNWLVAGDRLGALWIKNAYQDGLVVTLKGNLKCAIAPEYAAATFRTWLKYYNIGFCGLDKFDDWGMGEIDDEWYRVCKVEIDAKRRWMREHLHELRGKNLACWCPLDQPCHADALLELANI